MQAATKNTKRKIGVAKTAKAKSSLAEIVLHLRTSLGQLKEEVKDRELEAAEKQQVKELAEELIFGGNKLLSAVQ